MFHSVHYSFLHLLDVLPTRNEPGRVHLDSVLCMSYPLRPFTSNRIDSTVLYFGGVLYLTTNTVRLFKVNF